MRLKNLILILLIAIATQAYSQTANDVLNVLIANKTIAQEQADSIRAEAAIKQQELDMKKKSFFMQAARSLQLSGFTHIRYQNLDETGKMDGFDLRRARLDLRGNISPYWSYRLHTDFATTTRIIDAYAECKIADYLNVQIGQTKIPLSFESNIQPSKLEYADWSLVIDALTSRAKDVIGNNAGRDIGVMLLGSFWKVKDRYLFDYRAGLFNGAGSNVADNNEAKDVALRLVFSPFKGLGIGSSYYNGYAYYGTPAVNKVRKRFGFDIDLAVDNLIVRSEYLKGRDGSTERDGWFAQAGYYFFEKSLLLLAKYDTYNPVIDKVGDKQQNYSFGFNYYFNQLTRLQVFYTFRREEDVQVNNNIGTIQLQIGF
jgi:hypothetical protein